MIIRSDILCVNGTLLMIVVHIVVTVFTYLETKETNGIARRDGWTTIRRKYQNER